MTSATGDKRSGQRPSSAAAATKTSARGGGDGDGAGERDGAARQLAGGGARVGGVEAAIDDAVEAHRGGARGGDRDDDESRRAGENGDGAVAPGERGGAERERQREDGVRQRDQARVAADGCMRSRSSILRTGASAPSWAIHANGSRTPC